ncbi:ESX secretion-associated protein EspG [Nocardia jejuensis]|uniref:ESX secretion-associated protein EspG n=1 Tax=Nocardia jejuensis TaxID=328049 RepID=UPI0008358358|nr:ESX secretion-associated protein EspG [Nocardia jejuensis]
MSPSWCFTEAEFYVLWMDHAGEDLPEPFMFTSATRTAAAFEAELHEARETLSHKLDGDCRAAFESVANPDLYLVAYGWNEQDRWGQNTLIRARVSRRGAKGYVTTQQPGSTYWRGGGYRIIECDPLRLAAEIIRALPACDRGSQRDFALAFDDQGMDYDFGHSRISAETDTTVSRTKEFLSAPAATVGEIHIAQGRSVFGPRGLTRHRVTFRDVEKDGRYAITENPSRALGVDDSRFISVLDEYIEKVVQALEDEDERD